MAVDVQLVHRTSDEPVTSIYDEVSDALLAEIDARVRQPLNAPPAKAASSSGSHSSTTTSSSTASASVMLQALFSRAIVVIVNSCVIFISRRTLTRLLITMRLRRRCALAESREFRGESFHD
jgi:hypothetical protein